MGTAKPSGRKYLGGFDNLTASGINRFETLLKLASKHRIEKETTKTVQMGKDTLKQMTKCTATLSANLSLRPILLFSLSDANKTCLRADSETSNNSSDDIRKLIEATYKIQSILKYNEKFMLFVIVILL